MQDLNQPTSSLFISGSIVSAAIAGRAGYQIPIVVLCNTSICWQGSGASQLSAGHREVVLTFPVRVGCWLCRGYGNTLPLRSIPWKHPTSSGEASRRKAASGAQTTAGSGRAQLFQPTVTLLDKAPILGAGCPAAQGPREWGTGEGGLRSRKWQQVKADKSILSLEVKTPLPDHVGWSLPGEACDFLPPHTRRVKSLLLNPSPQKSLTLNRNKSTAPGRHLVWKIFA